MVDIVVEDAEVEVEVAAYEAARRWWRKREGAVDEDGDTSRQSSREKVDAEDAVKAAMERRAPGLPGPMNASRTKACTGVVNTGRARESAQPDTPLSEGLAKEASTTVAGAEQRRGRRCRCSLLAGVDEVDGGETATLAMWCA